MKQGSLDVDRLKSEGRHCFHRRKMLKNSPILNGDSENMDRNLARELNIAVAAAFHDHLSCTKSSPQEFCTIETVPKEVRINNNIPLETDHIYANSSETKNKSNVANNPSTQQELPSNEVSEIIISHSELIDHLRKQHALKNQGIKRLRTQFDRKHRLRRMCLLRKKYSKPSIETSSSNTLETRSAELKINYSPCIPSVGNQHSSLSTPVLATRYFGRRSKTVPSRALKRRYLGPPKTLPIKKELFPNTQSPISLVSEKQNVTVNEETPQMNNSSPTPPKVHKKRGRKPKNVKRDHLTTDSPYFLPDNQISPHSCTASQIDVPLWKLKPVTSFYQMEGTENINDPVFQRRHAKCELDERRRKRWDMQRLREQKVSQKLKYKNCRGTGKEGEYNIHQKSHSFYPDPRHIEYIEVADILPVIAFGRVIPLFQPREFSLPWHTDQNQSSSEFTSSSTRCRKGRPSNQGTKVT